MFISKTNWKREAGFIFPANFQRVSTLDQSIGIYPCFSDIFGQQYTIKDLEKDLSSLPLENTLLMISKILIVLENQGYTDINTQIELMEKIFNKKIIAKILLFVKQHKNWAVFFEQQLLVLSKYATLFCKRIKGESEKQSEEFNTFARTLLGVTELLNFKDTEQMTADDLKQHALQSLFFNEKNNIIESIIRAQEIFIKIPESVEFKKNPQYLDLPKLFKEATGMGIQDYLYLAFRVFRYFLYDRAHKDHLNPPHVVIDKGKSFSGLKITPDLVSKFLKETSISVKELKSFYKDHLKNPETFMYSFGEVKEKPLITFEGDVYFPISLRFLKEKVAKIFIG